MKAINLVLKYVLLLLGSFILVVFVFEIGLRSIQGWYFEAPDYLEYDKEIGTILRPSFKQTVGIGKHRNILQHNSLGLRGPEVRSDDPDLRIFIMGDSYTYGWGTDNSGTIASQLQAYLKGNGHDAEVLNLGVGGYSTAAIFLRFRRLSYLKPDIVIYMFCDNDPQDNISFVEGKAHPRAPEHHRSLLRVILRRHSILLRSFLMRSIFIDRWIKTKPIFQEGNRKLNEIKLIDLESTRLTMEYTNKVNELADTIGAEFFIIFINFRVNELGNVSLSPLASAYRQLFEAQGYKTISATEEIENHVQYWEEFRGDVPFYGTFQ